MDGARQSTGRSQTNRARTLPVPDEQIMERIMDSENAIGPVNRKNDQRGIERVQHNDDLNGTLIDN